MIRSIALSAMAFALAAPAFAGDAKDIPNVLVIKVDTGEVDQTQQQGNNSDQNQNQTKKNATLTPVKVDLKQDDAGNIDKDQLVKDANQAAQQNTDQAIKLDANQQLDDASVPDQVKQIFKQGEDETEALAWRMYSPWHSGAYYGYSRYPSWGFYPLYSYYPTYGYYYSGYTYPYSYGYSSYSFPYSYYYYWRW